LLEFYQFDVFWRFLYPFFSFWLFLGMNTSLEFVIQLLIFIYLHWSNSQSSMHHIKCMKILNRCIQKTVHIHVVTPEIIFFYVFLFGWQISPNPYWKIFLKQIKHEVSIRRIDPTFGCRGHSLRPVREKADKFAEN
jgi:hypothetical protein